jgi:hypothetical protein
MKKKQQTLAIRGLAGAPWHASSPRHRAAPPRHLSPRLEVAAIRPAELAGARRPAHNCLDRARRSLTGPPPRPKDAGIGPEEIDGDVAIEVQPVGGRWVWISRSCRSPYPVYVPPFFLASCRHCLQKRERKSHRKRERDDYLLEEEMVGLCAHVDRRPEGGESMASC